MVSLLKFVFLPSLVFISGLFTTYNGCNFVEEIFASSSVLEDKGLNDSLRPFVISNITDLNGNRTALITSNNTDLRENIIGLISNDTGFTFTPNMGPGGIIVLDPGSVADPGSGGDIAPYTCDSETQKCTSKEGNVLDGIRLWDDASKVCDGPVSCGEKSCSCKWKQ